MTDNEVSRLKKKLLKQKAKTAFANAEISVLMRHLEKFNALGREHERVCDALNKANRDIADLKAKGACCERRSDLHPERNVPDANGRP